MNYKKSKWLLVLFLGINTFNGWAQTGLYTNVPEGGEVLFDGTRQMLDEKWTYWDGPRLAAQLPIKWEIQADPAGLGTVVNTFDSAATNGLYGAADIVTKKKFRDFRLHVEFYIQNKGGNSGVYLQNRYEIQVLDGDATTHGMAAIINEKSASYSLYNGLKTWNAYDIIFRAARFDKTGKLIEKALMTMYFNGVKIYSNEHISKVWGGPNSGIDGGNDHGNGITDQPGGIKLQSEGHQVLYRNIWIKELDLTNSNTDI